MKPFSKFPACRKSATAITRLLPGPEQRDLFVRYLTAASHGAGELEYFAKIFPNQNYLHGHRFVTGDEATPSIAEVAATDSLVLGALAGVDAPDEAGAAIRTIRGRLQKSAPR